ncbi:hypothetical protein XW81_00795 [Buchnera aphidicola (Schlechtendalia chinensis)]|uniref:Colicin V production protein n=1 Tax=Buchnera aphidicola subsp. Schlechtendalia chinensis TaxID=118110 RepID=A0A172WDC5_BUCSC|nr:hypothetical protein XW81_00795 [Buchnera aphidicola (Schlechtendalia chinensis)]
MNTIDCVSIIIIAISTLISFFRGFFQEIVSILIWCVGIYMLFKYYSILCFFSWNINHKITRYIVNFVIFFISFLIIKFSLDYLITIFINKFHLFFLNQILGIFFGIVRGIAIICTILFFLEFSTSFVNSNIFKTSLLVPYYNYFIKSFLKLFIKNIFL